MKPRVTISMLLLVCVFLPGFLLAQVPLAIPSADIVLLKDANILHYRGKHAEAQKLFEDFLARHPLDPLAVLLYANDRFIEYRKDNGAKLPREEYLKELGVANDAIRQAERYGCGPTLQAFADDTLDCAYVKAALYLFRVGIRGANDGWVSERKLIGEDRKQFEKAVGESKAAQRNFLFGFYEYTASEQSGFFGWVGIRAANVPHNRDQAIRKVLESLQNNSSPIVDDVYFFIFDKETKYAAKGEKSGFEDEYPLEFVAKHLYRVYSENKKISAFCATARCGT